MPEEVLYILWYLNKVKVEISMVCRNQWEYLLFFACLSYNSNFCPQDKKAYKYSWTCPKL